MSRVLSDVRQTVRQILRDEFTGVVSDQDWQDDEIDVHIGHTLEEISQYSPYRTREAIPTALNSRAIDITPIENLIQVTHAEYPPGSDPRDYRNVKILDSDTIEIDTTLTPEAGELGVVLGIVTFTSGSTTVTCSGAAAALLTQLDKNYFIKPSSSTRWYLVYSVESNTSLTLAEPVRSIDAVEDDENATTFCSHAALLYCAKLHELDEDSSTLNPAEEKVLIDGSVAYVALAWVNTIRTHIKQAVSILTSSESAIRDISNRIDQSIDDLSKGRTQIDDARASADTAIDNMVARISQAMDNLSLGQTYINKINYGGSPENDYANYAARELSNANTFLNQARGYISEGTTADRFGSYAARELQNANSFLNQAGGYIRQATGRLSIGNAVNTYQTWATTRLALYQRALRKIEKPKNWREYPKD